MSLHGVQDKLKLIHKLNICKEMSVTYLKSVEVSGTRFHNRKNRDTLREACLPLVSAKLREIPGSNQTNLRLHNMRTSVVFVLILICLTPKGRSSHPASVNGGKQTRTYPLLDWLISFSA